MSQIVELEIPARAEFLAVARLVVVSAASIEPAFTEERLDNLRLAVSEACTNAIEAHRNGQNEDRVHIRCDLNDERIEVEVVDRGNGFDPDDIEALPDVEDPRRLDHENGLGLMMMRHFTDEAEIRSSTNGTAVRLVVYSLPDFAGS